VLDEEDDPVKPNARSWVLLERFRRLGVEERVHVVPGLVALYEWASVCNGPNSC
jgi:hypothetical protein